MPRLSAALTVLDATTSLRGIERWALADRNIGVNVDHQSGTAIVSVKSASGARGARIVAGWDQTVPGWGSVVVEVFATADPVTAARLNRVLGGAPTLFPHVETYHRTGKMVIRYPGQPIQTPARFGRSSHTSPWRYLGRTSDGGTDGQSEQPKPAARTITDPVDPATGTQTSQTTYPDGRVETSTRVVGTPTASQPATPEAPTASQTAAAPVPATNPSPDPVEPVAAVYEAPEASAIPQPIKVVLTRREERPACGCTGTCLFTYPPAAEAGRIVVTDLNRKSLNAALATHRNTKIRQPGTVMLVGPKGTGKTELVSDFAAQHGLGVFTVDGAAFASFTDWVGGIGLQDSGNGTPTTKYRPSSVLQAIRADGPHGDEERIFLVDEVNRSEVAGAVNALISMLTAGTVYVAEGNDGAGETVRISRNVLWMFTMNRGSAYVTTNALDAAIADRMQSWLRTDYLDQDVEARLVSDRSGLPFEQSLLLVRAATQIRAIYDRGEVSDTLSTRRLIDTAVKAASGHVTLLEACEVAWANYYSDEGGDQSERHVVLTSISASLPA